MHMHLHDAWWLCFDLCVTIQRHVTSSTTSTEDLLSYKKQVSTMKETTGEAHTHFPAAAAAAAGDLPLEQARHELPGGGSSCSSSKRQRGMNYPCRFPGCGRPHR
jgi:hypothetical protein